MLQNLAAVFSPNSFNLEKYLSSSKTYTSINSRLIRLIQNRCNEFSDFRVREGILTKAFAYSGTLISITDEELAKKLYTVIDKDNLTIKLTELYSHFSCFCDLKFFVDKKHGKVVFIYYKCMLNRSNNFIKNIYRNIQILRDFFSNDEFKIHVDYQKFISDFLSRTQNTSFLTAFFTSITTNEYKFTHGQLAKISSAFIFWYNSNASRQLGPTSIPGMYISETEQYFVENEPVRDICLNILKFIVSPDSFDSYESFFTCYDTQDLVDAKYKRFNNELNFVFSEELLQNPLNVVKESDDFIVYSELNSVVVQVKQASLINNYLNVLSKCVPCKLLTNLFVASNQDKSRYYLVFCHKDVSAALLTLDAFLANVDSTGKRIADIIKTTACINWPLAFKGNTNLVECFNISSGGYLHFNPAFICNIDFNAQPTNKHFYLFLLQLIATFVKLHNVDVNSIYAYAFMNIVPANFANELVQYIKTDKCEFTSETYLGKFLQSDLTSRICFLENIGTVHPDRISFIPTVLSNKTVQAVVTKKSQVYNQDYINSTDCLSFVKKIGTVLSDDTISEIFLSSNTEWNNYLTPESVIISKDYTQDGEYLIIGVVWNKHGLKTIRQLLDEGSVDSKVLYSMICSFQEIRNSHTYAINPTTLPKFLVTKNYRIVLNRNIGTTSKKLLKFGEAKYFEWVTNTFKQVMENAWNSLDHFDFDDFVKQQTSKNSLFAVARNMTFCQEHKHWHLKNTLCVECKKIYTLIEPPTDASLVYDGSALDFYEMSGNYVLAKTGSFIELISKAKLGIENNIYDNFIFKPIKIAIHDSKPYGIIFNKIDFSKLLPLDVFTGAQRLKVVLVLYKKLLPYILDGSFISGNSAIYTSMAMHRDYQGEILIPNLPFMMCSTVLQQNKEPYVKATLRAFAKFLIDYLTSDEHLKRAIDVPNSDIQALINDIQNLNFTEQLLRDSIYLVCDVHKIPFSSKHVSCPLCQRDGIMRNNMIVHGPSYFENLRRTRETYEGGEATLYPCGNSEVQKVFKAGVDIELKSKIVGKALQKSPLFHEFNQTHEDIQFVTINKLLYENDSKSIILKGFVQNFIADAFKISSLRDKEFVKSQGYTPSDIVDILIKVCKGIEFLHSIGGYIGDLNGGNILIKGKVVYFIDMDGMSFDEVKNFVYTDTYIYPPSSKNKNITKDDDWYSLAIHAFYYLTYSHPFRGISNKPKVPQSEIERMSRGLSVLGNHGINPPSISIGWHFLPQSLVEFFLNTFEGKKRESMRKILEDYATQLSKSVNTVVDFQELPRKRPCKFALSANTYLSEDAQIIWCEKPLANLSAGSVNCRQTGEYLIFFTQANTLVLNDKYGTLQVFSPTNATVHVRGLDNKLFYVEPANNQLYVKQINQVSGAEIVVKISRATTNKIFSFLVTQDLKFIFLEQEDDSHLAIYCNSEKLTSIDVSEYSGTVSSDILKDPMSNSYLVFISGNKTTLCILISNNGTFTTFKLNVEINKSYCFYQNMLYYTIDDKICFYNVLNGETNYLSCCYATSKSLIERKNNLFVICTDSKTYVYTKT